MATPAQRQHLLALMRWTIQHEPLIRYEQRRPMLLPNFTEQELADRFKRGDFVRADCSEYVTALCKWAGLADPNGNNYDGTGYTGTMLAHLPHYTEPSHADVGALVVYGPAPGEHVSMVMVPGGDPVLCSHGTDGGPLTIPLSRQRRVHRGPVTFLNVSRL